MFVNQKHPTEEDTNKFPAFQILLNLKVPKLI